ncbi:hypothetical protein [Desulfoluna sp.]|uniref:hypothetical protein n=1 Tax=Desulfoluna sp. TaxID=2045199 RepID=UPI002630DC22|nr:hypothetical protein [Desulfoluna sp.]
MMKAKPKMRPSSRVVAVGLIDDVRFIIEICFKDRWLPLGDSKGMHSFYTKEERDAAMEGFQDEFDEREANGEYS